MSGETESKTEPFKKQKTKHVDQRWMGFIKHEAHLLLFAYKIIKSYFANHILTQIIFPYLKKNPQQWQTFLVFMSQNNLEKEFKWNNQLQPLFLSYH